MKKKIISLLLVAIIVLQVSTPMVFGIEENTSKVEVGQDGNIKFLDENLKNALIDLKYDINNDEEISVEEMQKIDILDISQRNITDISPLIYAINMTELNIEGNSITDISVLENIGKLQYLYMQNNNFDLNIEENIEIILYLREKLSSISFTDNSANLNLNNDFLQEKIIEKTGCDANSDNKISKYEAATVKYLSIQDEELTDISGIENFKNIETIYLNDTSIQEITVLKNLKKLSWVSLQNTKIDDITIFVELENLQALYVENTNVDFSKESNLNAYNKLKEKGVYVNVTDNSEIINFTYQEFKNQLINSRYLDRNQDGQISKLEMLTLNSVYIYNINYLEDLKFADNLKQLSMYLYSNPINLDIEKITLFKKLESLEISGVQKISNLRSLSELTNLKKISIEFYYNSTEKIIDCNDLKELVNLEEIRLSAESYLNLESITNLPNVKKLNLYSYWSSDNNTTIDCEMIKNMYSLQELTLSAYSIENIDSLSSLTNLTTINLSPSYNNKIDCDKLKNIPNLEKITLTSDAENMDKLGEITTLKELSINNYYGIEEVSWIKNLTNLEKLNISGRLNNISDYLSNLKKLKELYISNYSTETKLSFEGMDSLENLTISMDNNQKIDFVNMDNLENLKSLNIWGYNPENVENVNKIKEIPQLEMLSISCNQNYYNDETQYINIENLANPNLKEISIQGYFKDISALVELQNIENLTITNYALGQIDIEKYLDDAEQIKVTNRFKISGQMNENIGNILCGETKVIDFSQNAIIQRIQNETSTLYNTDKITLTNQQANSYPYNINSYNSQITLDGLNASITANSFGNQKTAFRLERSTEYYYYEPKTIFDITTQLSWLNMIEEDSETEINIPDENFKKVLLEKYDIDKDNRVTKNDLANIEYLDISNCNISSIEGIENAINLKQIIANNNKITSLELIANMNQLENFNFENNKITDVTPIKNMENISTSNLANNYIEDITPLKGTAIGENVVFFGNYIDLSEGSANAEVVKEWDIFIQRAFRRTQKYSKPSERNDVVEITERLKNKLIEYGVDSNQDGNITKGELNDYNSKGRYGESMIPDAKMDLSNLNLQDKDAEVLNYLNFVTELDLSNNQLTDASPLSHMPSLDKVNLANNQIKSSTLEQMYLPLELDLSSNSIEDISFLNKMDFYDGIDGGWFAGGGDGRCITLNLSHNQIKDISPVNQLKFLAKLDVSYNEIRDISCLKDYNFALWEYEDEKYENIEAFELIDVSNNYIDINKAGNKAAIEVFTSRGISVKYDNQTVLPDDDTYIGNINSELISFNVGQSNGSSYVSGEIVVVEWVDGQSTVPKEKPIMKFKSTDGTINMDVFVTATGTNTYYFDRFIEGIDTSKEYVFEIASGDEKNVSANRSMNVYFTGTKYDNTIVGRYKDKKIRLLKQSIKFEDDTYIGNINSELKTFNVGIANNSTYVSGEIVVVEWVDGKSTVPEVAPKMSFKSTDGTINMEVFVTATGTNTYYFDRFIEGIDTSKEYYFEIESGDSKNISEYRSMNVYFTQTKYNDTVVGRYHDKRIRLLQQKILFEDDTYIGNINSELKTFNVGVANNACYVSGEIVVVEWVDGKSTVPEVAPKMRFKSTDGTVNMEVFVTATGTNTYYFDRFIEGIDTSKEYYFEIESGDERNASPNKSMNVYFTQTKYNDTIVGKFHTWKIRLLKQKIIFEDDTYVGNINSELKNMSVVKSGIYPFVSGEIVVVEWVDGKSTVPEVAPKMRFKSTDGTVNMEVFVTATGTNTYYFDRTVYGIDLNKEYYFEIESGDERNVSPNKSMKVYFNGDFANKIIGSYDIKTMVVLEDNLIKFKPLDESYPIIMNDDEKETLDLINQQRANYGLQPLKIDSRVQLLARTKAEDMVANNYFDHTSPIYGSPFDMLNKANIYYLTAGENIAGSGQNYMTVYLWMNSEGHRANILDANFNYTGIGVVNGGPYGKMYVQIFIGK